MRARGLMCVRMVSSAALFSSGIRMCLYILMRRNRNVEEIIERFEYDARQKRVQKQLYIEQNNNPRCRPAENFQPTPISKLTHFHAVARTSNQRPHSEPEPHAHRDLTHDA